MYKKEINKLRRGLYRTARMLGDLEALSNGKVIKRVERRAGGRVAGKILKKVLK